MREAQAPGNVTLNNLLNRLKDGRYVIPDFQRDFEWEARDIRELTRSIFLDYYIGSLLLWRGNRENFLSLSCEPIQGHKGGQPEHIVLDGQQRLTAVYYAFVAPDRPLPRRRSRALFYARIDQLMLENHDDSFDYYWVWPGKGDGLDGARGSFGPAEQQYERHIFPMAVIGAGGWALPNWVQGYRDHWRKAADAATTEAAAEAARLHADNAERFGDLLKGITEQFQISFVELDRELAINKVCDIFTQINSRGVRLDIFDLMNALLKPKAIHLKTLWREAEPKLAFAETPKMNVYVLQVMSIIRQNYCSPKYLYHLVPGVQRLTRHADGGSERQVMIEDPADFEQRWRRAVAALEKSIKRLRHPHEFGVSKSVYLPYSTILPIFAAALALVDEQPPENRIAAERKFRRWYWASVFNNRYSASAESTAARDYQAMRAWFADDAAEPAAIGEFKTRLPALDLRGEIKKGNSTYNAVFNVLIMNGARDWLSDAIPDPNSLDDHHIVPKSWGAKTLSNGTSIDSILNRTPLTAETNRDIICDKLPNRYLPDLIARNGQATIEAIMASHLISPAALAILLRDPFTPDDFEAFVGERQRTLSDAIRVLLNEDELQAPADLKALDARIEQIELALRAAIAEALGDDPRALPGHVWERVKDRVDKDLQKNPGVDRALFRTLGGALAYADLRELQDVMVNATTGRHFTGRFPHKESLIAKFGQLAELRNRIRHSRAVDDVTRKEGEAAILWFEPLVR